MKVHEVELGHLGGGIEVLRLHNLELLGSLLKVALVPLNDVYELAAIVEAGVQVEPVEWKDSVS